MNPEDLRRSVMAVLARIPHPETSTDLITGGHVQNLEVDPDGATRFQFLLRPGDPGDLVKAARTAVEALEGVASLKINVQLPQMTPGGGGGRKGALKPGSVPAPTPKPGVLSGVGSVIAVSSGKGGVGKSMVAANLAAAFARRGKRVGLIDADIYGPNIPLMFGVSRRPSVTGEKGKELIEPLEAHGVRLMSLGFLLDEDQPAIMRGPLISGILKQFLEQVDWGPLDIMVVDMPPGTGDAQLSLVQSIDVDGAVMVTTPQKVATGDVRRGIKMFERVNTRVLGIVENMSGLACPHCNKLVDVFGTGGGQALAKEMSIPFLGKIPLDPAVVAAGDHGAPTVLSAPESAAARALEEVVDTLEKSLAALAG
ncbi:MAG: Mrp/NBP35 family ATP-binding protein [Gemmatimonadetes bacterium]|nr:Mrp/NBP35 family ATP-binding protein [Gemmatimonadota bacterium]MDA1104183.1 Mrp/NBP35 family ATP-binding protein [Gemmatimonadota bacterium]